MSSTEHRRRLIIASALLVMTAMLVTHPQPAEAVVPASNGKIAFYSDRSGDIDIWLMDADGSNPVNLSQQPDRADFGPAWAPDGTQLVWFSLSLDTFNWDIFAMDADGTNQRNLTDHWSDNLSPNWSPDGSKILFDSNRSGVSEVWVGHGRRRDQPGQPHQEMVNRHTGRLVTGRLQDRLLLQPIGPVRSLGNERRRHQPDQPHKEAGARGLLAKLVSER